MPIKFRPKQSGPGSLKQNIALDIIDKRSGVKTTWRRIRKITLRNADTDFEEIAREVNGVLSDVLAMQLKVGSRHCNWINPMVLEIFQNMQKTHTEAGTANGNDSARRFWRKLETLYEFDAGLGFAELSNELKNYA